MMQAYIERFHNPTVFTYLHPVIEAQLRETYGLRVHQEEVTKVGHHFAGLDLADADVLRRAMSGKYRLKEAFQELTRRFFDNFFFKGYSEPRTLHSFPTRHSSD